MRKLFYVIPFGLLLLFPVGNVFADDMQMALLLVPPGEMLARAYTPGLADSGVVSGAMVMEEGGSGAQRDEVTEKGDDSFNFNVTFGKSWFFQAFRYKRIPVVTDPNLLAGFEAKAEQNRCGTIETKWPGVNKGIELASNFFAGSPLLLDPEYFVDLSVLYGEDAPIQP
jgi:hypothetical protein